MLFALGGAIARPRGWDGNKLYYIQNYWSVIIRSYTILSSEIVMSMKKMRSLFSFVIQGDVSVAEEGKKNCSFNLLL
jgi:hypothetical protein